MPSEDLKRTIVDVDRLVKEYVEDTADFDRIMNLMRRVLDDGEDAVLPLLLATKKHASDEDFACFAGNLIREIMKEGELNVAGKGAKQNIEESKVVLKALERIAKLYQSGDHETARGLEEVLAMVGTLSLSTLEAARKANVSKEIAPIIKRVIGAAREAAGEPRLPYDSKLGMPRNKRLAQKVVQKLGKRSTGLN